jgi:hypothetical protein
MARVQVDGLRSQVALQPQAAPVNTFVQAEQSTPTDAEMRARLLEGALGDVRNLAIQESRRTTQAEIDKVEKETALAAAADFVTFKTGLEPKLRDRSPEEVTGIIDEAFGKRYGDFSSAALNHSLGVMKLQFSENAVGAAVKAQNQKKTEGYVAASNTLIDEVHKNYKAGNVTFDEAAKQINDILLTASFRKGDTDATKPSLQALNAAAYTYFANDKESDFGWKFAQANKHDTAGTPAYERSIASLRSNYNTNLANRWELDARRQLSEVADQGMVNTVKALARRFEEEGLAKGLKPTWTLQYVSEAQTAHKKALNREAQNVALNKAVNAAVNNNGLIVEGATWTDADGVNHSISASTVKQTMFANLKPDSPAYVKALNYSTDGRIVTAFSKAAENLRDINDPDIKKSNAAITAFRTNLDFLTAIEDAVGLDAVKQQLGGQPQLLQLYQMTSTASKLGIPEKDIARAAHNLMAGRAAKPPEAKVLDKAVETAKNNMDTNWFFDKKFQFEDSTFRSTISQYYAQTSMFAASPEAAMEQAIKMFQDNHIVIDDEESGHSYVLNTGDKYTIALLTNKTPDNVTRVDAQAAFDKLPRAANALMADLTKKYPNLNPDSKSVVLMPDPYRRGQFVLQFIDGAQVPATYRYTASDILKAERAYSTGVPVDSLLDDNVP